MLGITLYLTFLYFAKRSWFFHMILVGAISMSIVSKGLQMQF